MRNHKRNKRDNRRQWIRCSQISGTNAFTAEVITHQARALRRHILKSLRILQVIKRMIMAPLQVRLTLMIFLLLAPRTANQLLQTRLQVLQGTWQEHRDVLLAPESHESHLRLVPLPHNKTSITSHQCTHQIISHHLLIFQFRSRHHLLHLLMHLMHIQPLCQIFQLHSPL